MRSVAIVGAGMVPFGELFDTGMKEMLPRTMTAALASVDKGMTAEELQAAWFGNLQPSDGFPAGVLADSCGLLDIPVTRVENQCATGNDAVRNAALADRQRPGRRRTGHRCGQDPRDLHPVDVLGLDGNGPRQGVGLPAGSHRTGQLRAARRPIHARVRRAPRTSGAWSR